MVLKNSEWTDYVEPLKKLFPKGEYWDKLLKDENSDVSLVCKARAKTLSKFRERINQLQREAFPDSAAETIGDWERVYFGYENGGLSLEQRRSLLHIQKLGGINISIARAVAGTYGGTVRRWEIPYVPAAFGHAQFGASYMPSIGGLWVVFMHVSLPGDSRKEFEAAMRKAMLANQTIFFVYGD